MNLLRSAILVFNLKFNNNDELWNFSNIYKMANGYTIYKDLNVIDTPLFFWLGELLFNFMGDNYLTYRIYNLIIIFLLYYLIYLIFKTLKISKLKSIVYMLIIFLVTSKIAGIGANYNSLAIVFYLLRNLAKFKNK